MRFMQSKASYESHRRAAVDQKAAQCLGWASIAIGLTEILAPKQLEKTMGVGNGQVTGILRVLGVREIMHGVDILAHDDPTPGVWSRVFGDLLDGVLLGAAATGRARRPDLRPAAVAGSGRGPAGRLTRLRQRRGWDAPRAGHGDVRESG